MTNIAQTHENPPAVLGPFNLRETILLGVPVLLLLLSFIPISTYSGYYTVWSNFSYSFFNGVIQIAPSFLVPAVVAGLIAVRRLSVPALRIGSFSIDQVASAAYTYSFGYLLLVVFSGGASIYYVLALLVAAIGLVASAFAYLIPLFKAEFLHREEASAHPVARQIVPAPVRPKPVYAAPVAPPVPGSPHVAGFDPAPGSAAVPIPIPVPDAVPAPEAVAEVASEAPAVEEVAAEAPKPRGRKKKVEEPEVVAEETATEEAPAESAPVAETTSVAPAAPVAFAPFWLAVPSPRPVIAIDGNVAFVALPGVWILAIDQHPEGLILRDANGAEGLLRQVADIQRA
ncbi:MAG: hypothetical protein KF916_06970 [Microbacteriaceae bacterium]|nr:hypothetical protein [Microbacteriaceae bacterium]